ncbi:MAG: hypothetical protein AAF497_01440 [Planctomycetota bacterium]
MQYDQILRAVTLLCLVTSAVCAQSKPKFDSRSKDCSRAASPFDDLPTFTVSEFGTDNRLELHEPLPAAAFPVATTPAGITPAAATPVATPTSAVPTGFNPMAVQQFATSPAAGPGVPLQRFPVTTDVVVTETNPYADKQYFNPITQGAPQQFVEQANWQQAPGVESSPAWAASYSQTTQPAPSVPQPAAIAQATTSESSKGFSVSRMFRSMIGRTKPEMPHAAPIPMLPNASANGQASDVASYVLPQPTDAANQLPATPQRATTNPSLHRWWGGTSN